MEPGRAESPIEVEDDGAPISVDDLEVERLLEAVRAQGRSRGRRNIIKVEDDQQDEKFDDREILAEDALEEGVEYVDLTIDEPQPPPARAPARNPSFHRSHDVLGNCQHLGFDIKPGTLIELTKPFGRLTATFVQVEFILRDRATSAITIRGLPLTRTRYFGGQLERKLNEVCIIYEIEEDDPRPHREQALVEVPLETVLCPRKLRKTNAAFPAFRYRDATPAAALHTMADVEEKGLLVCRWQYAVYHRNAAMRKLGKAHDWAFSHLRYEDSDDGYGIRRPRDIWRGATVRGGSSLSPMPVTKDGGDRATAIPVDADSDEEEGTVTLKDSQKYTLADMFSGAGGTSRGAERAGFAVEVAVDHWDPACFSYAKNFRETVLYHMDIYDFLSTDDIKHQTDVLHLSPPCQVWSPAHTVPGQNDSANVAVLFSCQELIKKFRPRIFTLEQTFGILHPRFRPYFNSLIRGFTSQNYSVRWKVVHLSNWGLPQPRKRLIMIGSCHGESLPPLPPATHGDADTLKPFVTARAALKRIGRYATLHNVNEVKVMNAAPWNPDSVLPRTITCSGGQNYHWSGSRDLTLREFASFQGFPTWHRFCAPYIKKQIGNAFPPCVVKVLYDHIRTWLLKEDKAVAPAGRGGRGGSAPPESAAEVGDGVRVVGANQLGAGASQLRAPLKLENEVFRFIEREAPAAVSDMEKEVVIIDDSDAAGSDTEEDPDRPASTGTDEFDFDSDTETARGDSVEVIDSDREMTEVVDSDQEMSEVVDSDQEMSEVWGSDHEITEAADRDHELADHDPKEDNAEMPGKHQVIDLTASD